MPMPVLKTLTLCLLLACASPAFTGCKSLSKNTYKAEQVGTKSVKAAIIAYEDAVKAGFVSWDTVVLAKQALETYKNAGSALLNASEAAQLTPDSPTAKDQLALALRLFNAAEGDLMAIITRYTSQPPKK